MTGSDGIRGNVSFEVSISKQYFYRNGFTQTQIYMVFLKEIIKENWKNVPPCAERV